MKYIFLLCTFLTLILGSCTYDYDADKYFGTDFTPQVMLNSIINPDSAIKAELYWSKNVKDKSEYKKIDTFTATLYEDDNLIFKGNCLDGKLTTNIKPKEGSAYRIEIKVPNYEKLVWAETYLPKAPTANISFVKTTGNPEFRSSSYYYFKIEDLRLNDSCRSVMIKTKGIYTDKDIFKYINRHYVNNSYLDQFNVEQDYTEAELKGSSMQYINYIRIPQQNITLALPITYSIRGLGDLSEDIFLGYDEWGYPKYEYIYTEFDKIVVDVISPSDDYDRYCKSLYKQQLYGDPELSIFADIIQVHSNINNGVGIFAAYSLIKYEHQL